ncbi:MAG: iron-containing alcohol dehydrogenase [Gammaproteobacteria bacterium]|nr:iron-containing alcohol dehydrogenase [Gammaproteobacteria bacterium]MCP5406653.1 iron-containing alcohol dehydrogenase [Chromatiaceae bacterium]
MEFVPCFELSRLPRIIFGVGQAENLPERIASYGHRALIVTGSRSLSDGGYWDRLVTRMAQQPLTWAQVKVEQEPSPDLVDDVVAQYHTEKVDVVVAVGGGSVLDAAKAIAGLLPHGNSVMDHLEGVGAGIPYSGPATPFIAVPTTAGTGSEATKNAVLSRRGDRGFKKSFRHEALVAHTAIIDPAFLRSCPRELMAAQGMDAFTQLLESFVSRRSNPITDALSWSGIQAFVEGFFPAIEGDYRADEDLSRVAYASLMSGICLAQAGLGSVHGLASPLGAYCRIPHGVACGTLLAEAVDINIRLLTQQDRNSPALGKYARVGSLFSAGTIDDEVQLRSLLVATLRRWIDSLEIRRLGEFGITEESIPALVAGSWSGNMQSNPALMSEFDVAELIRRRI